MREFELRFRACGDISERLAAFGFKKAEEFDSCDIIFEPMSWNPGDDLKPGYFAVRIRLVSGRKPKLEMKEYIEGDAWEETCLEISSPREMMAILSKTMNLRRCVSKHRAVWKSGERSVEICADNVEHLGAFVEIEGAEKEVCETARLLGFDIARKQPNYGAQLFYLERDGKLKFSVEGIMKTSEKFMR